MPEVMVEVSPPHVLSSVWLQPRVEIGAQQSTLQDIKLEDVAGGFSYKESNSWGSPCANRHIFWKTNNEILELVEVSLDQNLLKNQLRIRFCHTPLLNGLSITELKDSIIILVATVASVHRLTFPHPSRLVTHQGPSVGISSGITFRQSSALSIFHQASTEMLNDPSHYHALNQLPQIHSQPFSHPVASTSWVDASTNDAIFVLGNSLGNLQIVRLFHKYGNDSDKVLTWELKKSSFFSRLWSSVPIIFSRGAHETVDALSLVSSPMLDDVLVYCLSRDLKLQIWSHNQKDCLLEFNIMNLVHGTSASVFRDPKKELNTSLNTSLRSNNQVQFSARKPVLRKGSDQTFAAFVVVEDRPQFIIFKAEDLNSGAGVRIEYLATIGAPEVNLIDFSFESNVLRTVWYDADDQFAMYQCPLYVDEEDNETQANWTRILLENELDKHTGPLCNSEQDPRTRYIIEIFYRGQYSFEIIDKAIKMYSQRYQNRDFSISHNISFLNMGMENLIEEARNAVETRVARRIGPEDQSEEQLAQLYEAEWMELYSLCAQYRELDSRVVGIAHDSRTGNTTLIKKSTLSFIRPAESINHTLIADAVGIHELLSLDVKPTVATSLKMILDGVRLVSECLTDESKCDFELFLEESWESVDAMVQYLVENFLSFAQDERSGESIRQTLDRFTDAPDFNEALEYILAKLDEEINGELGIGNAQSFEDLPSLPLLDVYMSSAVGVAVIVDSLKQFMRIRYNFCRNLLVFQFMLVSYRNKFDGSNEMIEQIRSRQFCLTLKTLRCYHFLTWISETFLSDIDGQRNREGRLQLALNDLTGHLKTRCSARDLTYVMTGIFIPRSFLSEFVQNEGSLLGKKLLRCQLAASDSQISYMKMWESAFPLYLKMLTHLMWPLAKEHYLAEYLLAYGHFGLLSQYVNRMKWCHLNPVSREFLDGICLLVKGRATESCEIFKGIISSRLINSQIEPKDNFFHRLLQLPSRPITLSSDNDDEAILTWSVTDIAAYYKKVMQLFKCHSNTEQVIDLAKTALTFVTGSANDIEKEEALCPLYCTLFTSYLDLNNIDEAYQVMISNPDPDQRKICLRQFIVHLTEQRRLADLVNFKYPGALYQDFVSLMESRARASDLSFVQSETPDSVNYYQILYSFFIKDGNMRKAASTLYEFNLRLRQEISGTQSLIKQVESLLVAINCLKLVDSSNAWIVKPSRRVLPSLDFPIHAGESSGSKRTFEDKESDSGASKTSVEVLDLHDLRLEYELTSARRKLLKWDERANAIAASPLSAQEVVTLFIATSMFDSAFRISKLFELPLEPIFEGLTAKYISLLGYTMEDTKVLTEVYECLQECDAAVEGYIWTSSASPRDKMWQLITHYLDEYESLNQSFAHRCVTEKILSSGFPLPVSLRISYQKRNFPEYLRLLIKYDQLVEAANTVIEYVEALMGKGGADRFDIPEPLMPPCPSKPLVPIHLPNHIIDILIHYLVRESENNFHCKQALQSLDASLSAFKQLVRNVSQSILHPM